MQILNKRLGQYTGWLLFIGGVCLILLIVVIGQWQTSSIRYEKAEAPLAVPVVLRAGPESPLPIIPLTLRVPSLGLTTAFIDTQLGLTATGEAAVPTVYDRVGWYGFGPVPGELGPAVILGHVDSRSGPAVFYSLGQLKPGDKIFIDRSDGKTVTFVVTELERPTRSVFPTTKVYGDIDYAGLRLITCSGIFNRGKQLYSHNLIVYARLVDE